MSESSLTEIVLFAVEDLVWPFYNPYVLRNFQTVASFAVIYAVASLCNIQHWITGLPISDQTLDVVMNMKTKMNPVNVLSFAVIVVGVAARSLIILTLVYIFFLQIVETLAQVLARGLIGAMKDKKERSGGKFEKRDVDNLRAILEGGSWAQEELLELSPAVNDLVVEIYERLELKPVERHIALETDYA